jgi:hypothetical protein
MYGLNNLHSVFYKRENSRHGSSAVVHILFAYGDIDKGFIKL